MKRKRADRADWPRIAKKRFVQTRIDEKEFCGYVTLFCIDAVHQPLWKNLSGQSICLVDQGYLWLQQFPLNAHYSITSIFDAQGNFVRWYIDICISMCPHQGNWICWTLMSLMMLYDAAWLLHWSMSWPGERPTASFWQLKRTAFRYCGYLTITKTDCLN